MPILKRELKKAPVGEKIYIGIDNGTSGSIGIVGINEPIYLHTPIIEQLSYTKEKKFIHRIHGNVLRSLLKEYELCNVLVVLERPMINPTRFNASLSAIRCLEATLIILEELHFPYKYIDSKFWQKEMLPDGLRKEELKKASLDIGKRIFPNINFKGFKDADGILIGECCRRKGL